MENLTSFWCAHIKNLSCLLCPLPIRALRWPHAMENSLVFYRGGPSRTTRHGKHAPVEQAWAANIRQRITWLFQAKLLFVSRVGKYSRSMVSTFTNDHIFSLNKYGRRQSDKWPRFQGQSWPGTQGQTWLRSESQTSERWHLRLQKTTNSIFWLASDSQMSKMRPTGLRLLYSYLRLNLIGRGIFTPA